MENLVTKKKKKYRIKKAHSMDYALVISTLLLSLIGIVLAYSASYYYSISKFNNPNTLLLQNLTWYAIGWFFLIVLSRIDYHFYRRFAFIALGIGFALLFAVLILRGTPLTKTINNATRWINIGVTIMPGEIIKPAIILFFAALFSARPNAIKEFKTVMICFVILGLAGFLIYKQPNLSTAVIVVLIGFAIMLVAGLSIWWVIVLGGLGGGLLSYIAFIDEGYMHTRLITAIDPWADPLGDGYQVVQSLLAFGSGGVKGVGLGQSIQKTLYLPEPQSDFILPIIGEEIGFIGILCILILYAILIGRILSVAMRAKDAFGCYLAVGTGALLSIHIILNILVVTATFPPTGVFLPFMSQGGNATLIILALIGIVLHISRQSYDIPKEEE